MADLATQSEFMLRDYLRIFYRRRWVLGSFFVICAATVSLGTYMMTPLYEASTKVIIEMEHTDLSRPSQENEGYTEYSIFENYIATQIALIKSEVIAGKVFEDLKLGETSRYKEKKGFFAKLFGPKFNNDISIDRVRETRMIEIYAYNPEPQLAADIANSLSETYVRHNMMSQAVTYIQNQKMAALNADFLRLQSRLDELSKIYGPKHPEMVTLKEEVRAMSARIQDERDGRSKLNNEAGASNDQEPMEELLLNIQKQSVLLSSKINNISIVQRASAAKEPTKPNRALNIGLGIILGFVGGILLALFIDYQDDTIKEEEDLKKLIGERVFLGALISERKSGENVFNKQNYDQQLHLQPDSATAEAYRLLRTRLIWSLPKDKSIKDLAILSSIPGEGKTTITSNLAIALSQLNLKILLVDTDIRRGRLGESYRCEDGLGLGQYLSGTVSIEAVLRKTDIPNISVVPSGKSVINPSQLFGSSQMSQFIQEMRKRYDIILYDTPPITVISDAAIVASQLGGVIFVTRTGVTHARILKKALTTVDESHSKLIGVVLNGANSMDEIVYSNYYHSYQKL